jgi:hypothetical protein
VLRRKDSDNTTFVFVIEPHGSYSPVSESSLNSNSNIAELKTIHDDLNYTAVSIVDDKAHTSVFILANKNASTSKKHTLEIEGKTFSWTGPFHYTDN